MAEHSNVMLTHQRDNHASALAEALILQVWVLTQRMTFSIQARQKT